MNIHWHPYLVHFPIALMITSCGFYLAWIFTHRKELHTFSQYLLGLSILSAFFAGISGEKAAVLQEPDLTQDVLALLGRHELFANLAIWGGIATFIIWIFGMNRMTMDSGFKWVILILLIALVVFIVFTGQLGGVLVYNHGMGISP